METQTVIVLGSQGSGKGTQIRNIIEYVKSVDSNKDVLNLQTGKPFRDLIKRGGYTSELVKDIYDQGNLLPFFMVSAIVVNELTEHLDQNTHLFIDGFPRNLEQANELEDILKFFKREELSVVFLDTPEKVVRDRMKNRDRADDTGEAIDKRLRLYHLMTLPVVEYYKQRVGTNMVIVDGSGTVEEVQASIRAGLGV